MRKLSYFVFTSGEEGVHGGDYGIKFASDVFGNLRQLDVSYRELLHDFGLPPDIECPQNGVGLLVLQWRQKLMMFVFADKDLLGRPKTAAVAFSIPADIAASFTPRETARRIWSANDIPEIARRGGVRPVTAVFPDEPAPEGNYPFVSSSALLKWPNDERAYFSVNRNIREIFRQKKQKEEPPRKKPPVNNGKILVGAVCVMISAVAAGIYFLSDSVQDTPTPREIITVTESEDRQPSPDIMPEILPRSTENILTVSSDYSEDVAQVPDDNSEDIAPSYDETDADNTRQALYTLLKPLHKAKIYIDSDDIGVRINIRNIPSSSREELMTAHKTGYYSGISSNVMSRLFERMRPKYNNERIESILIKLEPDENLPAEINSEYDFYKCINIFIEQILRNKKGESH